MLNLTICSYNAILKYGWDNIEHEYFTTQSKDLMFYWEKILIYYHNSTNKKFGYNKTGGGEHNTEFSEDTIKKMSESAKGRKMSEETKSKISKSLKNISKKPLSEETKSKISKTLSGRTSNLKGIPRSEETKSKISKTLSGRTLPEEHKQKISEGNKGKTVSEETKRKMSEAMKLYWENKRKNNT